jgi:hypothetical protein
VLLESKDKVVFMFREDLYLSLALGREVRTVNQAGKPSIYGQPDISPGRSAHKPQAKDHAPGEGASNCLEATSNTQKATNTEHLSVFSQMSFFHLSIITVVLLVQLLF